MKHLLGKEGTEGLRLRVKERKGKRIFGRFDRNEKPTVGRRRFTYVTTWCVGGIGCWVGVVRRVILALPSPITFSSVEQHFFFCHVKIVH